jgi:predicted  nucleic acid-binding Zn-ribbon protein
MSNTSNELINQPYPLLAHKTNTVTLQESRDAIERLRQSETQACVKIAKLKEEIRMAEMANEALQVEAQHATERVAQLEAHIDNQKKAYADQEFELEARMSKGLRGLEQWTREKQGKFTIESLKPD